MHGTYQTVPDLWSRPLPFCTVHTGQYLTSDPGRYRYARYIPDSTWPLIQTATLCTVHTREYLTSDPDLYRYARYIPDSTWPLIQTVTIMHGSNQSLPDLWSSLWPLCMIHTRQYLTFDSARYSYVRYITDSTWPLILPVTVIPAFNCDCVQKVLGPTH